MACVLFQTVHVRWRTGTDLTPMCTQWDLCWMMVPPELTTLAVVSNTPNHSHQSMVRQPISSNSSVHLCVLVALYEYGIVLLLLKVNHYLYIFLLLLFFISISPCPFIFLSFPPSPPSPLPHIFWQTPSRVCRNGWQWWTLPSKECRNKPLEGEKPSVASIGKKRYNASTKMHKFGQVYICSSKPSLCLA